MRDRSLWEKWCDRLGVSQDISVESFFSNLFAQKETLVLSGKVNGEELREMFDKETLISHGIVVLGRLESMVIDAVSIQSMSDEALSREELLVFSGWLLVNVPGWHSYFLGHSHGTVLTGIGEVFGESSVLLLGGSRATAHEQGSIVAREDSQAVLRDQAKGSFVDRARATLWNESSALALEEAVLFAHDNSYVVLRGQSVGVIRDSASYSAFEESRVFTSPGAISRVLGKKVRVEEIPPSCKLDIDFVID